jgi:hypothetical protein
MPSSIRFLSDTICVAAALMAVSNAGFAATVTNPLCPQNTAFFNPDHGQDIIFHQVSKYRSLPPV